MSLENLGLAEVESLATLSKTLADNPATRKQFLQLIKTASPSTSIPEIDMEYRMSETTRPLLDKIDSLETQLKKNEFDKLREKSHERLEGMGISKNEITDVEKLMLEKQIGNYDTAAEFYLNSKQSAMPTPNAFSTPMTVPTIKDMGGDINKWARNEASLSLQDIIKERR